MKQYMNNEHGMALVLALVAVLIISVLLSGIMMLSVSHLTLSSRNSDYANAMNLAEAAVNWEFWKLNHVNDPTTVNPETGQPFTWSDIDNNMWSASKELSDANHTFRTVLLATQVEDQEALNAAVGTAPWTPQNECWLYGEGTVNGITRIVRVKVVGGTGPDSPNGPYALFGINNLDITGNLRVEGATGTNNEVHIDTGGSYYLDGDFYYCGLGGNSLPADGPPGNNDPDQDRYLSGDVKPTSLDENFRTVNELANRRALVKYDVTTTDGVDFFANNLYNNNNMIGYKDDAGVVHPIEREFATIDKYFDAIPKGVTNKVIVLEPGDYYFTGFDLPGGNTIEVLAGSGVDGAVNVWLGQEGSTAGGTDKINGHTQITSGSVTDFHIYQGSARTLWLEGTQDLQGSIYAYNGPDRQGNYYGQVQITGDAIINGSIIGYNVEKAQGNARIILPSSGGGHTDPGEQFLFYVMIPDWKELSPLWTAEALP